MNLDDFLKHHNCRCIMFVIKILDLPDQTKFVLGGRNKTNSEILRIPALPLRINFGSN